LANKYRKLILPTPKNTRLNIEPLEQRDVPSITDPFENTNATSVSTDTTSTYTFVEPESQDYSAYLEGVFPSQIPEPDSFDTDFDIIPIYIDP